MPARAIPREPPAGQSGHDAVTSGAPPDDVPEPAGPHPLDATADPFADLFDDLEAEEVVHAASDDRRTVRDLFAAAQPPPRAAGRAPRPRGGTAWPAHNYGAAYESLRASRPVRRKALDQRGDFEVWDVDEALDDEAPVDLGSPWGPSARSPPRGPAKPVAAGAGVAHGAASSIDAALDTHRAVPAWPERPAGDAADAWLSDLDPASAAMAPTEARLLDTAWSATPRPERVLFDVEEVLHARVHVPGSTSVMGAAIPPWWRWVGTASIVLLALALLQLLLLA